MRLPTRQDGVENRDKVYGNREWRSNSVCNRPKSRD